MAGTGGIDELDVAVRAWAIREHTEGDDEGTRSRGGGGGGRRVPDSFLVFDTETTIDASQRLLFGCWRFYRTQTAPDGRARSGLGWGGAVSPRRP